MMNSTHEAAESHQRGPVPSWGRGGERNPVVYTVQALTVSRWLDNDTARPSWVGVKISAQCHDSLAEEASQALH